MQCNITAILLSFNSSLCEVNKKCTFKSLILFTISAAKYLKYLLYIMSKNIHSRLLIITYQKLPISRSERYIEYVLAIIRANQMSRVLHGRG